MYYFLPLKIFFVLANSADPDVTLSGLENSTRPLVFTSVSGCRASEYFDIPTEN